jgi:hypothetical protein
MHKMPERGKNFRLLKSRKVFQWINTVGVLMFFFIVINRINFGHFVWRFQIRPPCYFERPFKFINTKGVFMANLNSTRRERQTNGQIHCNINTWIHTPSLADLLHGLNRSAYRMLQKHLSYIYFFHHKNHVGVSTAHTEKENCTFKITAKTPLRRRSIRKRWKKNILRTIWI